MDSKVIQVRGCFSIDKALKSMAIWWGINTRDYKATGISGHEKN